MKPGTELQRNAGAVQTYFDVAAFKEVVGRFPTGVAVVTAMHGQIPVGFSCQSFVSLSLDPPLIALAAAKTSTSWPRIRAAGVFCVNILAESQADLCRGFARSGSDKFAGVDWYVGPSGAPVLADASAWIECGLELAHDAGDHEIVFGRVVNLWKGGRRSLLFYESRFARVEELGPESGPA